MSPTLAGRFLTFRCPGRNGARGVCNYRYENKLRLIILKKNLDALPPDIRNNPDFKQNKFISIKA